MGRVIKTDEEGWDCVPELKSVAECISDLDHDLYEIRNCVRETDLEELVNNMKEKLTEAINYLDEINVENEYVTKYED